MELTKEDVLSRATMASTSARRLDSSRDALQLIFSNFDDLVTTLKASPSTKTFRVQGFRARPDHKLPEIACDPIAFAHDLAKSLDGTLCADLVSWLGVHCIVCKYYGDYGDIVVRLDIVEPGGASVSAHSTKYGLAGHWSTLTRTGRSAILGVKGLGIITGHCWPPSADNTVTMSWDTTFESSAGGTHGEAWAIRLGGEAPPLMVDQLTRSSSDLPSWQAMPLMADGASHTSSRATRSNTGKETELSKHVLLQGRGSNSAGCFAVIGVFNTATNTCVFWKRYYAYSVGGQGGGSTASLLPVGRDMDDAEPSSVHPRASSVAAPSINAHYPVAAVVSTVAGAGSAAYRARSVDATGTTSSAGPAAGGVSAGSHAGQKRLRGEESAEPDDTLAELDVEIALLESRKEALFAKRLQVQQLKEAVTADSAAAAAAKVAADAVDLAAVAVKEATVAAKEATAAAKEASVAADEAAAAAKEAAVAADEAAAAAEVATAASSSADGRLFDEKALLDAAQKARAATARRVEELRRGASESRMS